MALNGGLSEPFLRKVQVGHTSLNIQSAALYAISQTNYQMEAACEIPDNYSLTYSL